MIEINRKLEKQLRADALSFRAVTILGPRQSGKTTLTKLVFPEYHYVSLEEPEMRTLATEDPKAFLRRYAAPVIFDEIQRTPDLLSYIQGLIDQEPDKKGQFILTGSHQPLLRERVAQSLAGRTSVLILYPLSFQELHEGGIVVSAKPASHWIYQGFMPEIYRAQLNPTRAYQAYTATYVERDVRQIIQVKDQILFERFLKLLAGRIGQLLNFDSLASDVGVDAKTIKNWISVLEASFIVIRLAPFFENFGKRLVKAPKIYFADVGLAAYLLGLESAEQVDRDPLYGQLFENMVVMELVKARVSQGKNPELYFYRDSHGNEIDIIANIRRNRIPVEIKSSLTYRPELLKGLLHYMKRVDQGCEQAYLVYGGTIGPLGDHIEGVHYSQCAQMLAEM